MHRPNAMALIVMIDPRQLHLYAIAAARRSSGCSPATVRSRTDARNSGFGSRSRSRRPGTAGIRAVPVGIAVCRRGPYGLSRSVPAVAAVTELALPETAVPVLLGLHGALPVVPLE